MSFITFIISHKLLLIFIAATCAFAISTIVLGVDNANLQSELDEKSATTTTPTPIIPTSESPDPGDMSKYRLPTAVRPLVYDLRLNPDLVTGLFTGKVIINVTIAETTNNILLHIKQLKVSSVKFNDNPCSFEIDDKFELLIVSQFVSGDFVIGDGKLEIDYEGDMNNRIVGLYKSTYTSSAGTRRNIATSKFEPTYARQAFPCFDEPNMKAVYNVHILKPKDKDYIALSNLPVRNIENVDDDNELVHFEETDIRMSTYLACFIVADFKSTDSSFENNGTTIPFKVYTSPEQLSKTEYAGSFGKRVIEYYIKYFGIPYPLPKLDMVAIPDFVSGAMEHWGLVTFTETALLYTNETHSSANQQRVAEVVAHELAHSWFGNLVTMNWWNDLWLNEGFASYIQYKGTNEVEPSWKMMDQFLIGDLHSVLSLDATLNSHPIIKTVITPDQITEVFDIISYNKGASILRMLESALGETIFSRGVTKYLQKYAYRNAITDNFWEELQSVVEDQINVKGFMDTFTVQMGYPIVDVAIDSAENYVLTQKRFVKDPEAKYDESESPLNYKWTIPITYRTDQVDCETVWFHFDQPNLKIQKPKGEWLKFNCDQKGYYRINYPEAQWEDLIGRYTELNVSDRTHLLEETFSLAEAGLLNYAYPLKLTQKLKEEFDYVPWSVASSMLQSLKTYLIDSQQENAFKEYVQSIVTPAYNKCTWAESDVDDHVTRLQRIVVLNLACAVGYEECLETAKQRFDTWIQSPNETLSQDLRSLIYKYGMRSADKSTWDKMFAVFAKESDANEKMKLMNGLANVQDGVILKQLIDLAVNETYVRSQDYFTLLRYIAANPIGTSIVWDYVRENWQDLVARFTLNNRYLGSLIPGITSSFSRQIRYDEMVAFFAQNPEAGAGAASRKQALETVQNNIKWVAKYKPIVEDWIKSTPTQ